MKSYWVLIMSILPLGVKICRNAFMYMNKLSNGLLNDLIKHYKQHGLCPREFHYKGRNKKAVSYEQAKLIVDFLLNVSKVHALALPGRVPGKFHTT